MQLENKVSKRIGVWEFLWQGCIFVAESEFYCPLVQTTRLEKLISTANKEKEKELQAMNGLHVY